MTLAWKLMPATGVRFALTMSMSDKISSAAPFTEPAKPRLTLRGLVRLWFGFQDRVSKRAYLASGVGLMALKYSVDALTALALTGAFFTPLDYINPILALRTKALGGGPAYQTPADLLMGMVVFALPFLWIGVSMTIRRAVDAGKSPWLGLLFFVPGVNYLTMIVLAILPSKAVSTWPLPSPPPVVDARLSSALLGVAASVGIAAVMTGLSVFIIGHYGASLFAGTPLLMGACAAYIFNHKHPRSMGSTHVVAILSVTIAGLCLLLFALEGILCIAMAAPLGLVLGVLGAIIGRTIALSRTSSSAQAGLAVLLLPMLAGAEATLTPPLRRSATTVREIDAPPATVWQHVVTFSELPPPTEWFFDAGIAYPLRARIEGKGVGAVRYCEFSTGAFVEPITVWEQPRRLAFDVVAQPLPMKEWSPYAFVNAPHLLSALKSERGEFHLIPIDGGRRTRLEGTTWYALDMAPALYWSVWTEWLLHAIHTRVLTHIEHLSESGIKQQLSKSL